MTFLSKPNLGYSPANISVSLLWKPENREASPDTLWSLRKLRRYHHPYLCYGTFCIYTVLFQCHLEFCLCPGRDLHASDEDRWSEYPLMSSKLNRHQIFSPLVLVTSLESLRESEYFQLIFYPFLLFSSSFSAAPDIWSDLNDLKA